MAVISIGGLVSLDIIYHNYFRKNLSTDNYLDFDSSQPKQVYKPNTISPPSILAPYFNKNTSSEKAKFSKGYVFLDFNFTQIGASTDTKSSIDFSFAPKQTPTEETIYAGMGEQLLHGQPSIRRLQEFLYPTGITYPAQGVSHNIYNASRQLLVGGILAGAYGKPSVIDLTQNIKVSGWRDSTFANPLTYNFLQFARVNYGVPAPVMSIGHGLFGGVKWLYASGIYNAVFGSAVSVVNTTANQGLYPSGFYSSAIGYPNVSPRFIRAQGASNLVFGTALIQSHPRLIGFNSLVFGAAYIYRNERILPMRGFDAAVVENSTIEYRTKTIKPNGIDSLSFGKLNTYNNSQIVGVSSIATSALFGDIFIRNNSSHVYPVTIDSPIFSVWHDASNRNRALSVVSITTTAFGNAELANRNRYVKFTNGIDGADFGSPAIANSALSFTPHPFIGEIGRPDVSFKVRRLLLNGIEPDRYGNATLTKTPQLSIYPIAPPQVSIPSIELFIRYLLPSGIYATKFDAVAFNWRVRKVNAIGVIDSSFGVAVLTFANRNIGAIGNTHTLTSTPWVSFYRRSIVVDGITTSNATAHIVAFPRVIYPQGFIATQWLTRIIPEITQVFPQGFSNSIGNAQVENSLHYINVSGFALSPDKTKRFGDAVRLYNQKQYIEVKLTTDSELSVQPFGIWTQIANANRHIGVFGFTATKYSATLIYNYARTVSIEPIDDSAIGKSMIAYEVRRLILEGIEPFPMSTWYVVYNDARTVGAVGNNQFDAGKPTIVKTRRYYERVGNWESAEFGSPMIAYRVRNIDIESRYAITPPYINPPTIEKLTNYIEVKGFSADGIWVSSVSSPYLTIHRNTITPRWVLKDYFGEPIVWNKTPEVKISGHDSVEFGVASLRTQWRDVFATLGNVNLFGLHKISDTKQYIKIINGIGAPDISRYHKFIKGQSAPYSLQYILHYEPESGFDSLQFGKAGMNQNVLYPKGILPQKFGDIFLWSNNIVIEYGISQQQECGFPIVYNLNRSIMLSGINNQIKVGFPLANPRTIYHWTGGLDGEQMGRVSVENRNRRLFARGENMLTVSYYFDVDLKKKRINPRAITWPYFGIPSIPFVPQNVEPYGIDSFISSFTNVAHPPYRGVQYIKPNGFNALAFGYERVELKNRRIWVTGIDELRLGYSRSDTPYMWQSLRIGELVPFQLYGFDNAAFGGGIISLKIREVSIDGFDTLTMDYESKYFSKRMRVALAEQENLDKVASILGINDSSVGVHGVKLGQYFIRPDGNSETYRQGIG